MFVPTLVFASLWLGTHAITKINCWGAVSDGQLGELQCGKVCTESCGASFNTADAAAACLASASATGCYFPLLQDGTYLVGGCLDAAQSAIAVQVPVEMIDAMPSWIDTAAPAAISVSRAQLDLRQNLVHRHHLL
eukprot:Gregarina_sp_Pseudo_9__5315@NODE_622_length_2475_cov_10_389163_g587_i0_p2_GENE_NODE_622_length_2475_cov_10_389163_g587_i0NODE_622_length_2475_cov_10_389163_g587_i0_p2_ORF_typecomplete_len135_score17_90_NODE_622_length_2475_cov_10_389163_g587_i013461750